VNVNHNDYPELHERSSTDISYVESLLAGDNSSLSSTVYSMSLVAYEPVMLS
jgi:hypothetical protein